MLLVESDNVLLKIPYISIIEYGGISYTTLLLDDTQLEAASLLGSFQQVEHAMHDTRKKEEKQLFVLPAVNPEKYVRGFLA